MSPFDPCTTVASDLATRSSESGRPSYKFLRNAVPTSTLGSEQEEYAILSEALDRGSSMFMNTARALAPARADTMLNLLLKTAKTAGASVLKADFRDAKLKTDLALQLMFSSFVHTDAVHQSALKAGFRPGSAADHVVGAASNFLPVSRVLTALGNLSGKKLVDAARRILSDGAALDEGFKFANGADVYTYGETNFAPLRDKIVSFASSSKTLSDDQVLAWANAYREQSAQYLRSRTAAIGIWRRSNPSLAARMTDDAVAIEAGLGPTLHSYKTHLISNFIRTGERDEVIDMFLKSGSINLEGGVNALADSIRSMVAASPRTPFVNARGERFVSPLEALRSALPSSASDEPFLQVLLDKLKRLPASSHDDTVVAAMIPSFRNRFLLRRDGAQGFAPGFFETYRVVMRHGLRQEHLDPLMHPGGPVHDIIRKLQLADTKSAAVVAHHFRSIMGVRASEGPWLHEYTNAMSGLTKLVYNSLSRLRPGMAIPNILTIPTLLWPELVGKTGLVNGTMDLLAGGATFLSPRFQRLYRTTGLGTDYLHNVSAESRDRALEQIRVAMGSSNPSAVRRGMFDLLIPFTDILSMSESLLVRPWAAASGLARYTREAGARFDPEAARLAMIESVEAVTTLGLSTNSLPLVRSVRQKLGPIGPIATMFSATPLNIAGQMVHEAHMIVSGPNHLRGPAARSFLSKVFLGTLVAGPYWIWPWLREAEQIPGLSREDTETVLNVADHLEERYSLSGWLGMDLARRISPTAGVADVTTRAGAPPADSNLEYILRLLGGPAAGPATDLIAALSGDDNAQRRALGALAPMVMNLPPSQTLPSAVQTFLPAGHFFEQFIRIGVVGMSDPRGYVSMGPLGVPVRSPSGFMVDSLGRPSIALDENSEVRRFLYGGRTLDSATTSALGQRSEKKAAARQDVESRLRAAITSGNFSSALDIYSSNLDLNPQVDSSSIKREQLSKLLPPQARAVYFGRDEDAVDRARVASARLQSGSLSESAAAHEKAILFAAFLKLQ